MNWLENIFGRVPKSIVEVESREVVEEVVSNEKF